MKTNESIKRYMELKLKQYNILKLPIYRDDIIIGFIKVKGNYIEILNINEQYSSLLDMVRYGFNKKMFISSIRKFNIERRHKIIEEIQSYKTNSNEIVKFWV
jgi:hypothetical protein